MTDIQETFSHTPYSSYDGLSVLGNPRLVTVELELIMLSDATFAIYLCLEVAVLRISLACPKWKNRQRSSIRYSSFRMQGAISPGSGYRIRQFSFHPHTQIFIPMYSGL